MNDEHPPWFRLDNAALVFPAVAGRRRTTMFRISATLTAAIELPTLSRALERLAERTPYFQVELRGGLFWYFLQSNAGRPRVTADSRDPCIDYRVRGAGRFPYRIRAYGSRIALEISHILTDGAGALRFFRSLLFEYLVLKYELDTAHARIDRHAYDLLDPDNPPDPAEAADSFRTHYRADVPHVRKKEKAWRVPARPVSGRYFVTAGRVPFAALNAVARGHGVKLTAMLLGFHLYALLRAMERLGGGRKPLRVLVPVNMRQFYESRSMRNFFLYVDAEVDSRVGEYSLGELARKAANQIELGLDRGELSKHMKRNVGSERNALLRIVPRVLKDRVLAYMYERVTARQFSGSLSNLGSVRLPEVVMPYVRHFDFVPPPNTSTRTNCGIISYGDTVSINWGSTIEDRTIEREFFRAMVEQGVPVEVETNYTRLREGTWHTATAVASNSKQTH